MEENYSIIHEGVKAIGDRGQFAIIYIVRHVFFDYVEVGVRNTTTKQEAPRIYLDSKVLKLKIIDEEAKRKDVIKKLRKATCADAISPISYDDFVVEYVTARIQLSSKLGCYARIVPQKGDCINSNGTLDTICEIPACLTPFAWPSSGPSTSRRSTLNSLYSIPEETQWHPHEFRCSSDDHEISASASTGKFDFIRGMLPKLASFIQGKPSEGCSLPSSVEGSPIMRRKVLRPIASLHRNPLMSPVPLGSQDTADYNDPADAALECSSTSERNSTRMFAGSEDGVLPEDEVMRNSRRNSLIATSRGMNYRGVSASELMAAMHRLADSIDDCVDSSTASSVPILNRPSCLPAINH